MRILRSNKTMAFVGAVITAAVIATVSVAAVWSQASRLMRHFLAADEEPSWRRRRCRRVEDRRFRERAPPYRPDEHTIPDRRRS